MIVIVTALKPPKSELQLGVPLGECKLRINLDQIRHYEPVEEKSPLHPKGARTVLNIGTVILVKDPVTDFDRWLDAVEVFSNPNIKTKEEQDMELAEQNKKE